MGGQDVADGPGLPSELRHEPSQFDGYPGSREGKEQQLEEPFFLIEHPGDAIVKGQRDQGQHPKAQPHHEAKSPEHGCHAGNRIQSGLFDLGLGGVHHPGRKALQQQPVAQIGFPLPEGGLDRFRAIPLAQFFQQGVGRHAAANLVFIFRHELLDARHRGVDGTGDEKPPHPGQLDGRIGFLLFLIGKPH